MSDDRLQELYLTAVELDADARGRLLDELRSGEPALAAELARLLAADETEPSPIDRPAAPLAEPEEPLPPTPTQVGPYRIVRELGRGGMGRVFLAEQETPDFRRTVALKLIDHPRFDVDMVRRFREEVRILASLEHPGIVRFYDGGKSADGIWFLALEFVEGCDLLCHARDAGLGVRERVELFAAVASAMAYAHGKGVVHRDIKPANVLVDREGQPRLLDFGISKLLDPAATAATTTGAGVRLMTPAYASPEQLAGGDVTAASDVYSLGVVLYELLCGQRPIVTAREASGSLPPPSLVARKRLEAAGVDRSTRRLRRIPRELDAIALRALDTDPERRYPTAAELGDDLRRCLDRHSIRPRDATLGARTAIFLRARPWIAPAAGALVLALALWPFVRPGGRDPVSTPPAGSHSVSGSAGRFPFDTGAIPPADEAERRWAAAPGDPVLGAQLALALADEKRFDEARFATRRMRQIPGREHDPLADYTDAWVSATEGEQQRALVFVDAALAGALATDRRDLVGGIRLLRATTLMRLGQRDAARGELEATVRDLAGTGDDGLLERAWNALALERLRLGENEQCQAAFEAALEAAERAGSEGLVTRSNFARFELLRGRPDLAEEKLRELLTLRRARPNATREGQVLLKLASAQRDLGRAGEATMHLDRAIDLLRTPGAELSLGAALHERALFDLEHGRLDRIDDTIAELDAISRSTLHRRTLGFARTIAARRAALTGDPATARSSFAEARRLLRTNGDNDLAADSDLAWAGSEWLARDPAAAMRVAEEALSTLENPGATLPGVAAALLEVRILAATGRAREAGQRFARVPSDLESSPSLDRRLDWLRGRAALLVAAGDLDSARRDLSLARDLAHGAERLVIELEVRLELAHAADESATACEEIAAISGEAEGRGLVTLVDLARTARGRAPVVPSS